MHGSLEPRHDGPLGLHKMTGQQATRAEPQHQSQPRNQIADIEAIPLGRFPNGHGLEGNPEYCFVSRVQCSVKLLSIIKPSFFDQIRTMAMSAATLTLPSDIDS